MFFRTAAEPADVPLVPPDAGRVEFAAGKVLWLYLMLGGSALLVVRPPSATTVLVSALLFVLTVCAGHSVGLHRGIIHRTYQSSRWLRGLLAYCFVHTGIGGPVGWLRLHHIRDHYQNGHECPRYFAYRHSLLRDYYWNLHLRFIPRRPELYCIPEEDERDTWLCFLERTWPLHGLALALVLYVCFDLSVALTCVSARVSLGVLGHWFVGFLAHKHGYVRYELDGSPEIGRNLWLLGVLAFGEGFHNNHHANPGSARMGERWYELDLGFLLIRALERLGWITDVRVSSPANTALDPTRRPNARRVPVQLRFGRARAAEREVPA